PDVGGWFPGGRWPSFTRNALAPVPPHTKVVSFDTNPPAPDLIKAGKAQVLIGQKYFGGGSETVKLLKDAVHGKRPANPIIDSGIDIVTSSNVDDYIAKWKQMEGGKEADAVVRPVVRDPAVPQRRNDFRGRRRRGGPGRRGWP